MADISIKDASLINNVSGTEKIPVSNGSGKPAAITVNLILDKVDLSDYVATETLNLAVQAVNSNINGVNQSINTRLQNVSEQANKADATATDALNLVEGIQGNLSLFALKSELPTKVSQLENDIPYALKSEVDAKILELQTLINNHINGASQVSELDT